MEISLVFRELRDPPPRALRGCAHQTEDFLKLVLICGSREERAACIHLRHDTTGGPDVDAGAIGAAAE